MILNLKPLVAKFNDEMRSALEGAAALCVTRTHYEVELEHFLAKALAQERDAGELGDIALILKHYGVSRARVSSAMREGLDRLKTGNTRGPSFSPMLVKMMTEAWSIGSLQYGATQLRTGYAFAALLSEESLARVVWELCQELRGIPVESMLAELPEILAGSIESSLLEVETGGPRTDPAKSDSSQSALQGSPLLKQYTINLTAAAQSGRLDAVIGRDAEIRQMIDVLMRRRQNNPILTGEAGVGKTAVVEGLALRIAAGDVPPALRAVQLHSLDLTLLQAGASVKGEFENRLKGLIAEVAASPEPIILFIDEAHTLIGAGGQAGQSDAANILKPALARGELRTIAATTWSEYKRYFEKDAALTRRFQVVKVEEPSETQCEAMLRGVMHSFEEHHRVRILDEALSAAVRLSHRYLPGRQLPDKAVSVLDTACARVALSQNASPAAIETVSRHLLTLKAQAAVLKREQATGADHGRRLAEIEDGLREDAAELGRLERRWSEENELFLQMEELRLRLEASVGGELEERRADLAELTRVRQQMRRLQNDAPLTHLAVDSQIVGQVLSEWTGVPLGKMLHDEIAMILGLESGLQRRVIGQDHALAAIAQRVQTSRANLDDPSKPVGVFLLVGPSGVGKTETALALAEMLYGGEDNLITINMSEFQEPHSVSTLKGAPPGYVGYGEGGVLTEAVRRQPYSVVLLDEAEKAHPDVLELFFQVFDKGAMEDGEGRAIDFRNTLILMTTNAASDAMTKLAADPETAPGPVEIVTAIRPELNRIFKPALLGRMLVVPYYPIRDEVLREIIHLKLGRIMNRLHVNHGVRMVYEPALVELVRQRCVEVESGARAVDHLLANTLLPAISRQLLERMVGNEPLEQVSVGVSDGDELTYGWTVHSAAQMADVLGDPVQV